MEGLAKFAEGFIGVFQTGGQQLLAWSLKHSHVGRLDDRSECPDRTDRT